MRIVLSGLLAAMMTALTLIGRRKSFSFTTVYSPISYKGLLIA
jgi:hypothetical protein